MKSISTWETERLDTVNAAAKGNGAAAYSNITALKELAFRLLREA